MNKIHTLEPGNAEINCKEDHHSLRRKPEFFSGSLFAAAMVKLPLILDDFLWIY